MKRPGFEILTHALRSSVKLKTPLRSLAIADEMFLLDRDRLLAMLPVLHCELSLLTPDIKEMVELMEWAKNMRPDEVWTDEHTRKVRRYVLLISTLPRDLDSFIRMVDYKLGREELHDSMSIPIEMNWLGALQVRMSYKISTWGKMVMTAVLETWAVRPRQHVENIIKYVDEVLPKLDEMLSENPPGRFSGEVVIQPEDIGWDYEDHKVSFAIMRKLPKQVGGEEFKMLWWWFRTMASPDRAVWFFSGNFITDGSCDMEGIMHGCRAFDDLSAAKDKWHSLMAAVDRACEREANQFKEYHPTVQTMFDGYNVQSETAPSKFHHVMVAEGQYSCDCEFFVHQKKMCKHISYILEHKSEIE